MGQIEEIEVKILEIDVDEVEDRLETIGAQYQWDRTITSRYFDAPDGSIEDGGSLRVRQSGPEAYITRKQDITRDGAKIMDEIGLGVTDVETACALLESLGYEVHGNYEKRRRKWVNSDTEYVIDFYPGIPPLLEVEAPTLETVRNAVEELGYDMDDAVSWGARKLLSHYDQR